MLREIDRVLIDRSRIARRVGEMGEQIARDIESEIAGHPVAPAGAEPRVVLVPILTGSLVFVADLIRRMPLKLSVQLMTVSSYPGKTTQSQGVTLQGEMPRGLAGAHVLVVDDILDSGRTLGMVRREIEGQRPASLRLAVLLRKRLAGGPRAVDVSVEHVGFDIEDEFVVGYGLDFDGYYRNLPDIVTLRAEQFASPGTGTPA
ncbi:MAG: hypoxanthine phosphoribosyltransferase [Phycisphaerae bacterium]|nr:hypoxanthine phosphoribosyltransferase [Phycisphaerae bacterium]